MVACDTPGCTVKNANFNFPAEKNGKKCHSHKLEGMVDVKNKKCGHPLENGCKCTKQPKYGLPNGKVEKCFEHCEDNMVDLYTKRCNHVDKETNEKCPIIAAYGLPGGKKTCCYSHKLLEMIDLNHKKCGDIDKITGIICTKRPSYGLPNASASKCRTHATLDMLNVVSKKCHKCDKIATFGLPLSDEGVTSCKAHKTDEMCDLKHYKCIGIKENGEKCDIRPTFGFPGNTRALYCSDHVIPGMQDIMNTKCDYFGCIIQPTFNFEGLPKKRCFKHKEDGMINVTAKRCEFPGCLHQPTFNYENEKTAIRCIGHRLDLMVDIRHVKCEDCNNRAYYNIKNGNPLKCRSHKIPGMCRVQNKKCDECDLSAKYGVLFGEKRHCYLHKLTQEFRQNNPICQFEECNEKATCVNDGTNYPVRCGTHCLDDDVNIIERNCKSCNLKYLLNELTGLCDICNTVEIKKVYKIKETETILFLQNNDISFITTDKIPENSCSKFRPDGVIDFKYFLIVLEIDEFQHKNYDEMCEKNRMIQLHQDYGGIPLVFIRFNPDNYKIKLPNGEKKVVKPSNSRLKELLYLIKRFEYLKDIYETSVPLSPLSVCYIYYDNYTGDPTLTTIDIFETVKEQNKNPKPLRLKIIKN